MAHLTHTEKWCMENGCVDSGANLDPLVTSLGQQLTSLAFIRLNIFFIICSFWANFYIGTAVTQLGDLGIVPEADTSHYGDLLTLFMTGGVVVIPVVGWMMDVWGFPVTMFVTILFSIFWASLLCLLDAKYLIASFVCYALFRTFLFTFLFSYMADRLGFQFFGILVGILFLISGVVGLLQYPLSEWADGSCITDSQDGCSHGQWDKVNHIMLVSFCLLLFFPYQDHIERKEISRRTTSNVYSATNLANYIE